MRGIVLAHGYRAELEPLVTKQPSCLFPILGKPILFHLFDTLYKAGCRDLLIVLHHLPEAVEEAIGDPARFGMKMEFLLAKNLETPLKELLVVSKSWEKSEKIIIASGDSLPFENVPALPVVPVSLLQEMPLNITEELLFEKLLHPKTHTLSSRSPKALLESNIEALHDPKTLLLPTRAKKADAAAFICQNVTRHPSAKLIAPYSIGESCVIGQEAQIGPDAIIEEGSIIDQKSTIEKALILPHTYVGEGLEVRNAIVSKNIFINTDLKTTVTMPDAFILSALEEPSLKRLAFSSLERCVGWVCFFLLFPIARICEGSSQKNSLWNFYPHHKFRELFANLSHIAHGRAHFVGLEPRHDRSLEHIDSDHQALISGAKFGWAYLDTEEAEASFATDAYYAASHTFFSDCKLFIKKIFTKN